jgi:tRNA-dihydrouridine synthase B
VKIGRLSLSNKVVLAPMAGITNLPFRSIARRFGCALGFTEMVSAIGLTRRMVRSISYLDSMPEDRPLGVQIFGSDPVVMAEAARMVEDLGADLVDINMGCPVRKVVRTGAGAALLRHPDQAGRIIEAVRKVTGLPLTVKIRSGWQRHDSGGFKVIAHIAEEGGADGIIFHPRTVEQGFSGAADWRLIAELKGSLCIPVIGNGDIRAPADAVRMLMMTGCDGVMVGRGALGNPWIFRDINNAFENRPEAPSLTLAEREWLIRDHLEKEIAYYGDEKRAASHFRKHILWYTKGLRGGGRFRQVAGKIQDKALILAEVECFFRSNTGDGNDVSI